jgi:hypothetical protein
MRTSIVAVGMLFGLVLVGTGCASSAPADESAAREEAPLSDHACRTRCGHCPPNKLCALVCVSNGHCGATTCTETALCIEGYTWDEVSCSCVPSAGGGEACGNGTCGAGEFCCNASCGICAPVGGACTQEFCAVAL